MHAFALPTPDYKRLAIRAGLAPVDDAAREAAVAAFIPEFRRRYEVLTRDPVSLPAKRKDSPLLKTLRADGCVMATIDESPKAALAAFCTPLLEGLAERIATVRDPAHKASQMLLNREEHGAIYKAVKRAFAPLGLLDAAARYGGAPVRLGNMALQINSAWATRELHGAIDAKGVPEHATDYFHIDSAGWPHLRVVIYLTPVTIDRGPFRYVPGTHTLAGPYELAVRKTNHKLDLDDRLFLALPPRYRAKTDFGGDMDPTTREARDLLKRERVYADGQSDLVLFDYNGIHRGALVREGQRMALTVGFAPA